MKTRTQSARSTLRLSVRQIHRNVGTKLVTRRTHTSLCGINPKLNMPQNNAAPEHLRKDEQDEENTHRHNMGLRAVADVIPWNGFCYSCGMSKEEGKAEDELMRVHELELVQKRVRWQQDREKYRTLRVLSFSFLSLVILAGLIGFFFCFTRAKDAREQHPAYSPALSPH